MFFSEKWFKVFLFHVLQGAKDGRACQKIELAPIERWRPELNMH